MKPPSPSPLQMRRARRKAVTLIAGIRSEGGLILVADTEEVLGDALKTTGEKLHYIYDESLNNPGWNVEKMII